MRLSRLRVKLAGHLLLVAEGSLMLALQLLQRYCSCCSPGSLRL